MRCSAWPALRGIWENAARVMFRVPLRPRLDNPHLPSMLVALVGPACSGKFEVARYLIVHHHFRPAFLANSASLHQHAAELLPLCQNSSDQAPEPHEFASTVALLDYSTAHWRDNIVTLDLRSRGHIDVGFDKRPFFLLLGVDAPVTVRWRREMKRCEEPRGLSQRSKSGERHADPPLPLAPTDDRWTSCRSRWKTLLRQTMSSCMGCPWIDHHPRRRTFPSRLRRVAALQAVRCLRLHLPPAARFR